MERSRIAAIRTAVGVSVGIGIALAIVRNVELVNSVDGAVLIADTDPNKQLPLPDVEITGDIGGESAQTQTDVSGFFRLKWRSSFFRGRPVTLRLTRRDYEPYEIIEPLTKQLYVLRLAPAASAPAGHLVPVVSLTNVRVRYSIKSTNTIDVGSKAETFSVFNTGNIPCSGRVCSPDGLWKAALGSFSLDAGEGQEFQNARVSCIAGPCSFTRIEADGFARGGRKITGTVRAWSDTATFLVEAEILRSTLSDMIRQSYPSIFGRNMTFTLPPNGQGPAIQADVNGTEIVFPVGPAAILSWAKCNLQVGKDRTRVYSCVLNSGYSFR